MKLFPETPSKTTVYNRFFKIKFRALSLLQKYFSFIESDKHCICCGSPINFGLLCDTCVRNFLEYTAFTANNRCAVCGRFLLSTQKICFSCKNSSVLKSTDGVFPLHSYRLWKKDLLFHWKIAGNRMLSPLFAQLLFNGLRNLSAYLGYNTILPVVPVPPRPGKIKEKGWDQIQELCVIMEGLWDVSVLPLLKRVNVGQQKKLDRENRLKTIGTSYCAKPSAKLKKIIAAYSAKLPDAVVVVDDVITTGATIESCAEILKDIGIRRVFALTLFVVD